jgi:radical SAM protein with 4Fe4S-binding SPASM domain
MNPVRPGTNKAHADMSSETAKYVADFALSSPNSSITFEFQGGEPFLNFEAVKTVIRSVRENPKAAGKVIRYTLVSNLLVAREEDLTYCRDNNISVSYSLNGPGDVHDRFRVNWSGRGSYKSALERLSWLRASFSDVITAYPLCVIDASTAEQLPQIIDFFYDQGFSGVALLRAKPLGNAVRTGITFGGPPLISAYIKALDHILARNKKSGQSFVERMVQVALLKLLGRQNVGFVDWRNPCGDVIQAITYDVDGEILPADEARSNRSVFGLGNVRDRTFSEVMADERSYHTANLSLRDAHAACRECAYNPFCGVNPVVEFARTGSVMPKPHESEDCHFTIALLDWVVRNYLDSPLELFRMLGDVGHILREMVTDTEPADSNRTLAPMVNI